MIIEHPYTSLQSLYVQWSRFMIIKDSLFSNFLHQQSEYHPLTKLRGYSTVCLYTKAIQSGFYDVFVFQIKEGNLQFQKSIVVFDGLIIIDHCTCNQVL